MTQSLKNTYKKIKDGDFKIPNQANLTDNARQSLAFKKHLKTFRCNFIMPDSQQHPLYLYLRKLERDIFFLLSC